MNCMRCGRQVSDGVFCVECQADMDRHPIPAGTVLVLPEKKKEPPQRKNSSKKKELTAEEQVKRLHARIRRLSVALICLCLALALSLTALIYMLFLRPPAEDDDIGKNYGTMEPADTT